MIESYSFGHMVVDGKAYHHDIKIIKGQVVPEWWRRESHMLRLDELSDVAAAKPATLVVGTGDSGNMRPAPGLKESLAKRGIAMIAVPTGRAMALFNELAAVGEDVAGVFHLTC